MHFNSQLKGHAMPFVSSAVHSSATVQMTTSERLLPFPDGAGHSPDMPYAYSHGRQYPPMVYRLRVLLSFVARLLHSAAASDELGTEIVARIARRIRHAFATYVGD